MTSLTDYGRSGTLDIVRENVTPTDEQRRDELAEAVHAADSAWYAEIDNAELKAAYLEAKQTFRAWERDAIDRGATESCIRCGGAGGWRGWPGFTCFRCGGHGREALRKYRFQAAPNVRHSRDAKLNAEIEEKDARYRGAISGLGDVGDALDAANEEVKAFNANYDFAEPSRETFFRAELATKLWRYGSLSEKQIDAVQRGLDREAAERAEKAAAGPLEEGTYEIVGEIVSTKWQRSDKFKTLKMLVKLDNGNKVWGTVPKSLTGNDDKGTRVAFTAEVTRSEDDENFGYFSRPKNARVAEERLIA